MSKALAKVKARLFKMGAHPDVIASVTEQDLARALSPDKVSVECWKCGRTYEVARETAAGRTSIKCGWCYL